MSRVTFIHVALWDCINLLTVLQVAALAPLALLLVLEARCTHFVIAHFNIIVCCGVVHHCSHTSHNIIHDDKLAYYKDVSGHYRDWNGNSSAHVQGKRQLIVICITTLSIMIMYCNPHALTHYW